MEIELQLLRKRIEKLTDEVELWKEKYQHLKGALLPRLLLHGKYDLTETEVTILSFFLSNQGVFRKDLFSCMYLDKPEIPDKRIMDTYICRIRSKIKKHNLPIEISTIWGIGWSMDKKGLDFLRKHSRQLEILTGMDVKIS